MSSEYVSAIVLVVAAILKIFGIYELPSGTLEGVVGGVIALFIAIKRHARGDITIVGSRK